ncbi:MAG: peptidylprolyl isomerase, partial [Deltaproteobacteria bacterium]|nr:peptidylprolyl isomerase [Deltaproteobacteria bacterium]
DEKAAEQPDTTKADGDNANPKTDGKTADKSKDKDDAASRKRAEAIATRIAKGEAFVKVARETSEDQDGRASGGELGWRRKGTLGLSDADEAKLFAAKPGDVVGPVKSSQAQGWVLLLSSGSRAGTLTFDKVQGELAEEQLKQEKAVAIAKRHAETALAASKAAPDKTFKDLFPGEAALAAAKTDKTDKTDKVEPKTVKAGKPDPKAAATPVAVDARAEETGLFSRRGTIIEQLGDSPELAKSAWSLTAAAPLAGPVEIAGSYVVVRLKERKDPDPAELEKKKAELQRDAELAKWNEVFTSWVKHRCLEAKSAGKLTVNKALLKYEDSQEPPAYEPCGGDVVPRRPS